MIKNSLAHLFKNKNFYFIFGDIRKENFVKKIIKDKDFIFPLAALVGAPLCEKFKRNAKITNVDSVKMLTKNIKKNKKLFIQQQTLDME